MKPYAYNWNFDNLMLQVFGAWPAPFSYYSVDVAANWSGVIKQSETSWRLVILFLAVHHQSAQLRVGVGIDALATQTPHDVIGVRGPSNVQASDSILVTPDAPLTLDSGQSLVAYNIDNVLRLASHLVIRGLFIQIPPLQTYTIGGY